MHPSYRHALDATGRVENLSDETLQALLTDGYALFLRMFMPEQRIFIKMLVLLEIEAAERLVRKR